MKCNVEIYQATPRIGLNRVGKHNVFSATWDDGASTALVHRYRVIKSTQYGYRTIAAGDRVMDVADVLSAAYDAHVAGYEVSALKYDPADLMPVF